MRKEGTTIRISELTSVLDTSKKTLYTEIQDEKFYKVPIDLDTGTLDVVISEYMLKREFNEKVLLKGYIRSENVNEPTRHLYTFFMVTDILPYKEDAHIVYINGRLTKHRKLSTLSNGRQLLPIVIRCKTDDGNTSIIHAVLFNKDARLVNSYDSIQDMSISASGHINIRYGTVEIHIDEADIYRKEDRTSE